MSAPLVSILIPAYSERFFPDAFASARAQSLADLEIVVCDDSPGARIGEVVQAAADPRVRYVRNPSNLGFAANFTQCFRLAQGRYVKFLNDDDRLRPRCCEVMAGILEANPAVGLATSRRVVIDEHGRPAPDLAATTPVSHVAALMRGIELGDFVLVNSLNLIGEPTTAMFRRAELPLEGDSIFRWGGRDYYCLADLSLWLRVLPRGLAWYGAAPLSEYRFHPGQEQRKAEVALSCFVERQWILEPARAAGFLALPELRRAACAAVRSRAAALAQLRGADPVVRAALDGVEAGLRAFESS